MREKPCERVNRFAAHIILILMLAGYLSAQDGSGRSEAANRFFGSRESARKRARAPKRFRNFTRIVPATAPVEVGRIAVLVNEGGGQVQISPIGSNSLPEVISVSSEASSFIFRTLPVGRYAILVKKKGFFDETRTVDIVKGKRRRVEINLRPMMAKLTVISNIVDAQIDVENVGKFNRPLRKYFVKPGEYRVNVKRRGYLSMTTTVDLKNAGQEHIMNVVLQPLRIDSVLAQASENINRGNLSAAADLTNDVLLLNASHAKANLLFGIIEFHRGDPSSSSYFLRAVKKGETVTLPVKILEENAGRRLVEAELSLNRAGVSLRSSARFDLNYFIARTDISDLGRAVDPAVMTYIILNGKSDFHDRRIEPRLKIYSRDSSIRPSSQEVYCGATSAGGSCSADIDILFKLVSDWRSWADASTAAR